MQIGKNKNNVEQQKNKKVYNDNCYSKTEKYSYNVFAKIIL